MFAVLTVPDFPLRALLRFRPAVRGEPVALLAGEGRRARVAHVCAQATRVAVGMTAAQALAECPALQLLEPSLSSEREALCLLLNAAWRLSPRVGSRAAGCCIVDLAGADLPTLRGRAGALCLDLARDGLPVRIGIGPTALIAGYASVQPGEGVMWIDDPSTFLRDLPIELLELNEGEARLFSDLGLKTLGALTRFPRAALTNRLGARGEELWLKAAGEWSEPLEPAQAPTRHLAETELAEPVETLDPLLFVLRRFCDRLASEVGQFGGGTSKMALVLKLEDEKQLARDFDLPEPTARPDLLFAALENHLASLHTEAAIIGLSLEVFPDRRLQQQEGFWDTGLKDAPMFYATLGRLAAVVGSERVGTPSHADTHRPDNLILNSPAAFVPQRRVPAASAEHGPMLRRLRPPLPATVELTDAAPSFLVSAIARGEVRVLRRPFRASGDWWRPEAWVREEWDVQVGGVLLRLLHEPAGWFIDAIYD